MTTDAATALLNPSKIPLLARTLLDSIHEARREGCMDYIDEWPEYTAGWVQPIEELTQAIRAAFVKKPWGSYQDLFRTKTAVAKKITIDPGQAISLQRHAKRGEFWVIESGVATVQTSTIKAIPEFDLPCGGYAFIAPGTWHRIINKTDKPVVILELQFGECDEEDIERAADNYGRQVLQPKADAEEGKCWAVGDGG